MESFFLFPFLFLKSEDLLFFSFLLWFSLLFSFLCIEHCCCCDDDDVSVVISFVFLCAGSFFTLLDFLCMPGVK